MKSRRAQHSQPRDKSEIAAGHAVVTVNIKPGPASLAQKAAWRKFWQKIIAEVKADDPR